MDILQIIFDWGPKVFFTLLFAFAGYVVIRKKTIPLRISYWLLGAYVIERIVEISGRVIATYFSTQLLPADTINAVLTRVQLLPSLQQLLFRQAVVLLIGAVFWFLFSLYAYRTQESRLDQSDVNILTLGVCISGWPNFLIFLILVFFLSLIGLVIAWVAKQSHRMTVTPYVAIAGICMLYLGWWLSSVTGLYALR